MLIKNLASYIVDILEKNKIIQNNQIDIYQYGFEIFISSIITCMITIILGLIFKCILASFVYFAIFVLLRSFCGGYHAKTYWQCNMIFTIVTASILFLFKFMPINYFIIPHFCIIIVSILVIIMYVPVENINKPLNKQQHIFYRIVCIIITAVLLLLSCFLIFKFKSPYGILIDATVLTVMISVFVTDSKRGGEFLWKKK